MIVIRNHKSEAVISERGAHVDSLVLAGVPVIKEYHDRFSTHRGMAILFPYADIVVGGTFEFEGKIYNLPKNAYNEGNYNDSIHGLVIQKRFEKIEDDGTRVVMIVNLNREEFVSEFELKVIYVLEETEFRCIMIARNIGDFNSPVMLGAHPYLSYNKDWRFIFHDPPVNIIYHDNENVKLSRISGNTIEKMIDSSYDNAFFGSGDTIFETLGYKLRIKRYGMQFFEIYDGIFAPNGSVAFEPLTGAPNCLNNGFGETTLSPGEKLSTSFTFSLLL